MMTKLISIIIPVYNVEKYMDNCIESVLKQSYNNIEIILIDDGSTDKSGEKCNQYLTIDKRIKVIHKKNGGLSDARNAGIQYASGDYIMFIDSDDIVDHGIVEHLYRILIDTKADISICDVVHCTTNTKICYKDETEIVIYSADDAICEMLYQKSFLVTACAKLYKKALFEEIKFPTGIIYEDSATIYKIFDKSKRIVYSNAKLYGYIHHEDSITTKKFSIRDCDILKIADDMVLYFKERDEKMIMAAKAYQAACALRIILNAPKDPEYEESISYAKKIINKDGRTVLNNRKCRNKTRLGLLLYIYMPWAIKFIYEGVNRWK